MNDHARFLRADGGFISSRELPPDARAAQPAADTLARWHRHATGRLPLRSEFPPESFGNLLGRVSLLEPVADGADFLYRIYALIAANKGGLDLTGKRISNMPYPDYAAELIRQSQQTLAGGQPTIHENRFRWRSRAYAICCVRLPVLDGRTGTRMLFVVDLHADPDKRPDKAVYMPQV